MSKRTEPVAVSEKRGVYTLTHGKAKAVLRPYGDEVAELTLSGAASPRSWWMIGAHLSGAGQRLSRESWGDALRSDDMPQGVHATGIRYSFARGGCDVVVVDNSGNDADAEVRITARPNLSLVVKADKAGIDADQLMRLGALLMGVAHQLMRRPMGLFSADNVREIVADVCVRDDA